MRLLIALLLTACGTTPKPTPDEPAAAPTSEARPLKPPTDAAPAEPTVIFHETKYWVIGLPKNHGWSRDQWVELTSPPDERGTLRPLGVALVLSTDGGRADAAALALVGTVENADVVGARARVIHIKEGEWPHVGKLLATVGSERPAPTRIRLNVGSQDGVLKGDRYSLRRLEQGYVVSRGRVEVVEVGPTHAVAAIEDGDVVAGQALVFEPGRSDGPGRTVLILVCNFQPMSGAAQSLGESFAAEFRQRLKNATQGMKQVKVADETATVMNDGAAGHEEARKLGRDRDADLVVWGTARCHEGKGCTYPRFTVVKPDALSRVEWRADQPEFALFAEQQVAEEVVRTPEVLAAALLGFLSYGAQHYQDARQYLERALAGPVLTGDDRYRALRDLGDSFDILGQPALVLEVAAELEAVPDPAWAAVGRSRRASTIERQGRPDEALVLLERCRQDYERLGLPRERAMILGDIAHIRLGKGEVEIALALHEEELKVYEALGDRRSRAATLGDIAGIRLGKGEVGTALALHEEALKVYEALGDRRERAITLAEIARIRLDQGEVETALALHEEVLKEVEALGDRRSRAVTLGDIAGIRLGQGEVETALALHEEELKVYEALGDRRERAITLGDIARIRLGKGEVETALALHEEELKVYEALGDRRSRAVTLGDIARIRWGKGEVETALALFEEVLREVEALGDRRSRAVTLGDIARIRLMKGEVEAALALHEEKLKEMEALGDRRSRAVTLGDIARIRWGKGEVETALALFEEALKEVEALGDRRSRAVTLGDIAQIKLFKGDFPGAINALEEQQTIVESLGDAVGMVAAHAGLGMALLKANKLEEARARLAQAWPLAQRLGQPVWVGNVGFLYGDTLLKSGATAEAVPVLEAAVAAFRQLGMAGELQMAEQALAAARAAAGR